MTNRTTWLGALALLGGLMWATSAVPVAAQDGDVQPGQPTGIDGADGGASNAGQPDGQADAVGGEEQADGEPTGEEGQQPPPRRERSFFESWKLLLVMLGAFVLLWIFMGRSRKKQQEKRREMLASLKKGDRVVTIGGIVGTVMEVRENTVTVKVDETNNIRTHFARWAIQSVGDSPGEESPHER